MLFFKYPELRGPARQAERTSDMEEEKKPPKEAQKAMERALIPRTADGLIEPMIFLNEPPKEKLYPHIGVVNGAIVPMVCASDFEGGKPPDYLDYQLGHERPGAPRFDEKSRVKCRKK